jgi:hypothetical protein
MVTLLHCLTSHSELVEKSGDWAGLKGVIFEGAGMHPMIICARGSICCAPIDYSEPVLVDSLISR